MKVFVFDPLWPDLVTPQNEALLKTAGVEVVLTTKEAQLSECKQLFAGTDARILAVNPDYVGWSLPSEVFKDIPQLKAIITQSTSYGWIDTGYATQQEIAVVNIRNFSTDAVAEWAVLMMFNIARKIPLLIKNEFPLNFASDFQTYQGMNLKGKKAGIIGLGNIGSAIAERCQNLGMEVLYWSKSNKKNTYLKCDLETLFKQSDVVFPCMTDNDETKNIITDNMLQSMKSDSMFISIVHKYYNHDLLLEKVADNSLHGYAFEAEPASFANYTGNVWAAPAYGWCTRESLRASMDSFVKAITDAAHERFPNKVNT